MPGPRGGGAAGAVHHGAVRVRAAVTARGLELVEVAPGVARLGPPNPGAPGLLPRQLLGEPRVGVYGAWRAVPGPGRVCCRRSGAAAVGRG